MPDDEDSLRTFTFEEIEQRVAARQHIPGYREMLMESAVQTTPTGVVFNIRHQSWLRLVNVVQQADLAVKSNNQVQRTRSLNDDVLKPSSFARVSNLRRAETRNDLRSSDNKNGYDMVAELNKVNLDVSKIKKFCSVDSINDSNRASIWAALLDGKPAGPSDDLQIDLKDCQFDLFNQRVIRMDIQRTRPDVEFFRDDDGVRDALETILTVFCKRHLISYKQGINYVAAPFIYVFGVARTKDAYICLSSFIRRFCPNTFTDDQFGGLQCIFRVFRALLMYHCPELANFLDENDMTPELYASPWFMTIFSNRIAYTPLLRIWDHLILHEEPLILYFFAVAFLISNSTELRKHSPVVLPERLTQLNIESVGLVDQLFSFASSLLANTPASFITFFKSVVSKNIAVDSSLYERILSLECLCVSPQEVIAHCYPPQSRSNTFTANPLSPKSQPLKFFVIDCRPEHHYSSGHLPMTYHLDPVLCQEPVQLQKRIEIISSMTGFHFIFLLDSHDTRSRQQFNQLQIEFIKRGFKYVSSCQGGYSACHDLVVSCMGENELLDHRKLKCIDCLNAIPDVMDSDIKVPFKRSFFSAVRNKISGNNILNKDALTSQEAESVAEKPATSKSACSTPIGTCILPARAIGLSDTTELRLLFCGLRDSNVTAQQFTACSQRVCSLLISSALDQFPVQCCTLNTKNGFAFSSYRLERAIVAVALSQNGHHCLETCLAPFNASGRIFVGSVQFREEYAKQSDGILKATNAIDINDVPDGSRSGVCQVIVFVPSLDSDQLLQSLLDVLDRRGFPVSTITVLSIIAVRNVLCQIAQINSEVSFVYGALDQQTRGKADPGIGDFDQLYNVSASCSTGSASDSLCFTSTEYIS